eukprot:COSAG04_NODE_16181_length_507_cov_1.132353_2_plen_40_part_01
MAEEGGEEPRKQKREAPPMPAPPDPFVRATTRPSHPAFQR